MAARKTAAKPATKTAAKPKAAAKPAAKTVEKEKRVAAHALMDVKSPEFKALSERQQNWIVKMRPVAERIKNVHKILESNRGLLLVSLTTGEFQVGRMSESGKSFVVEETFDDKNDALEFYRDNREGNYGGEKAAAPAPAKKGKAAKPAAKPAKRKRAPEPEDDEDLDDLLD